MLRRRSSRSWLARAENCLCPRGKQRGGETPSPPHHNFRPHSVFCRRLGGGQTSTGQRQTTEIKLKGNGMTIAAVAQPGGVSTSAQGQSAGASFFSADVASGINMRNIVFRCGSCVLGRRRLRPPETHSPHFEHWSKVKPRAPGIQVKNNWLPSAEKVQAVYCPPPHAFMVCVDVSEQEKEQIFPCRCNVTLHKGCRSAGTFGA